MEEILKNLQELLDVPKVLIGQIPIFPDYIQQAIIESLYFVPLIFVLYFLIELLERFFINHIDLLVRIIKKSGSVFGVFISVLPECGFQVIAGTYYVRKLITRGTLLAYFISCSDDAYPLLFLNPEKANVLIPVIIIKIIAGIAVWLIVDASLVFMKKKTEEANVVNIDLNENGCCHHKLTTLDEKPGVFSHPLSHTFNIFAFAAIALALYYSAVNSFGDGDTVAAVLGINLPMLQVSVCALFGLVPTCASSVFLAIAYVKGVICFPALLAGLVTTTGIGLLTVASQNKNKNADTVIITLILLAAGLVIGGAACLFPVPGISIFAE